SALEVAVVARARVRVVAQRRAVVRTYARRAEAVAVTEVSGALRTVRLNVGPAGAGAVARIGEVARGLRCASARCSGRVEPARGRAAIAGERLVVVALLAGVQDAVAAKVAAGDDRRARVGVAALLPGDCRIARFAGIDRAVAAKTAGDGKADGEWNRAARSVVVCGHRDGKVGCAHGIARQKRAAAHGTRRGVRGIRDPALSEDLRRRRVVIGWSVERAGR